MSIKFPTTEQLIGTAIVFAIEKRRTAAEVEAALEALGVDLTDHFRSVIRSCVLAPLKSSRPRSETVAEVRRTVLGLGQRMSATPTNQEKIMDDKTLRLECLDRALRLAEKSTVTPWPNNVVNTAGVFVAFVEGGTIGSADDSAPADQAKG